MHIDKSGIKRGLQIVDFLQSLVVQQTQNPNPPDWFYLNLWPGWDWALKNAVDSHYKAPWADDLYDDIPF